jgi:hypothetical protein
MPFEVTKPTIDLHDENRFYRGDLYSIEPIDGKFGPQLKWIIRLDDDGTQNVDGRDVPRETWAFTSEKLTTHEKNSFRKFVKGLTGSDPVEGEMFDERRYTLRYYEEHPEAITELADGETPWRVAVMFQHGKRQDGTDKESVLVLVAESNIG